MHEADALSGTEVRQNPHSQAPAKPLLSSSPRRSSAAPEVFPVLLNDVQAAACLGVSVRKFHDLRHSLWMPRPVVLGPRMVRWPRAEIEQAVAAMPRQQAPSEPVQLRRAKVERMKAGTAA